MATETARPHRGVRRGGGAYWFDILFGRVVPAVFFGIFIVDKALLFQDSLRELPGHLAQPSAYLAPLSQALGLAYFSLLAFLYIIRLPKRAGDARPQVILYSFFGSFAILLAAWLPGVPSRSWLALPATLLSLAGLCYTIWSLAYLRRSFSIMPEARRLVTGGPYSISRHPLYLGEGVAAIGILLPTIGPAGAVLLVLFLGAQYLRLRTEERVLEHEFPDYAAYRARVPRYLPDPRRLLARR
jgi:protein-S-isoprenylcysteine O-methyltransferase Ste14